MTLRLSGTVGERAPAPDALEHRRNVRIVRLLARVALDRARVFPLVLVPLVVASGDRVQRHEPGVDARLHVAAVVVELAGIAAALAELREVSVAEIAAATSANARAVLPGLPPCPATAT